MIRAALLAGLLLLPAAAARAQLLACPAFLEVLPAIELRPPAGWQAYPEAQRHWLRDADLFEGDPAGRVQLVPDADRDRRRWWWDLAASPSAPYRLICRYEGIESGLIAEVPAAARRCEVRLIRENSRGVRHGRAVTGNERVEVACR